MLVSVCVAMLGMGFGATEPTLDLVVAAPIGGQPLLLPGRRYACSEGSKLAGWTIEADRRHLRPPPKPDKGAKASKGSQQEREAPKGQVLQPQLPQLPELKVQSEPVDLDADPIAHIKTTLDLKNCSLSREGVRAIAVTAYPEIDPSSVLYYLDAGAPRSARPQPQAQRLEMAPAKPAGQRQLPRSDCRSQHQP